MATQTRNPTSDEAASGTLSGTAGSRWTLVDDYPDTTGADVLTFGTTTAQITFGFSAFTIPAGSTGISVQVLHYDGEAATGVNTTCGRLKVGAAYFNAATHNPSGTTYTQRTDNWATNPATSVAWTVDQVNGIGANALAAFGIGSTDSNPTFRVSSVQLQVTYTAPSSSGSGAATASTATSSGVGSVDIAASGSAQASAATSDGTGEVTGGDITGSGSSTAAQATASGAGTVNVAASGAALSGAVTSTAAGSVAIGATGSSQPGAATSTGSGAPRVGASGTAQAAAATAIGYGQNGAGGPTVTPQSQVDRRRYVSRSSRRR